MEKKQKETQRCYFEVYYDKDQTYTMSFHTHPVQNATVSMPFPPERLRLLAVSNTSP